MTIYTIQDCLYKIAYRNKFDILANQFVKKIFSRIKNRLSSFILNEKEVKILFNVTIKDFSAFRNFAMGAEFKVQPNNTENIPTLSINLIVNKEFSKTDYQDLNYCLYEVIRHELEHYNKISIGKYPDKDYIETYKALTTSTPEFDLKKHVEVVAKYILSGTEVDSFAKSIVYVAKKQNKSALEVIQQVFNRAFFNNNRDLLKQAQGNKEIMKVVEDTEKLLMERIKHFYPKFKEKWL